MKNKKGYGLLVVIVLYVLLILFIGFGYIRNFYKATQLDFEESYKAEIFRCIGIFVPPAGVILGYISFDEENKIKE